MYHSNPSSRLGSGRGTKPDTVDGYSVSSSCGVVAKTRLPDALKFLRGEEDPRLTRLQGLFYPNWTFGRSRLFMCRTPPSHESLLFVLVRNKGDNLLTFLFQSICPKWISEFDPFFLLIDHYELNPHFVRNERNPGPPYRLGSTGGSFYRG